MAVTLSAGTTDWLRATGLRRWVIDRCRVDGLQLPDDLAQLLDQIDGAVTVEVVAGRPPVRLVELADAVDVTVRRARGGIPVPAVLVPLVDVVREELERHALLMHKRTHRVKVPKVDSGRVA